MSFVCRAAIAFVSPCLFIGCLGTSGRLFRGQTPIRIQQTAAESGETGKTIYVVGHGWHTGIVLGAADLSRPLRPGYANRAQAGYVEIGWGDEGFYRAKTINPALVFRAVFTPTPSVLHLVHFQQHPAEVFIGSDVVELTVTDREFEAICDHIRGSFATDNNGKAEHLGRGIYGDSAFYRGHESYYYPKTCNVWTARALQAGGVGLVTAFSTTAGGVITQAKWRGRTLRTSSPMAMIHALGGGQPAETPSPDKQSAGSETDVAPR